MRQQATRQTPGAAARRARRPRAGEVRAAEVRAAQVRPVEVRPVEVSPAEVRPPDVWPAETRLVAALAAWATVSTIAGALMWRVGRRDGERALAGAGRVSVAWGLADAAVAGWAVRRGRGKARLQDDAARARRMALVTGGNALLDVAYVAGGVRWARVPGRRGEGWATAGQGLFLLYLDTRYTLEFAAASRGTGLREPARPLDSGRARERRRPAQGGGAGPSENDTAVVRPVS